MKFKPLMLALALAALLPGTAFPANADRAALDLAIFAATKMPPHRCFVPIIKEKDERSYWVPIIINRAGTPMLTIDTGFTGSLLFPRNFIDMLLANGLLTKLDRKGPPVTSTLADGSEITQETIIIREIVLPGCRAFSNVRALISPTGSTPLLGQGILSRFRFAGIDHQRGDLILVPEGLPIDVEAE